MPPDFFRPCNLLSIVGTLCLSRFCEDLIVALKDPKVAVSFLSAPVRNAYAKTAISENQLAS